MATSKQLRMVVGEGGEKVLFSPVAERERVQSLRSLGAEHGQGCSVPHSGIPSTPTLLKASPVRCNQCCSRPRGMGVCVCVCGSSMDALPSREGPVA